MPRNSGKIFQIIDGKYKDKFFAAMDKQQIQHYLNQEKLIGVLYEDELLTKPVRDFVTDKKMLTIIHQSKLSLAGFIN